MHQKIFCPDIFSRSKPTFEIVSSEVFEKISQVLYANFAITGKELISAEKLSGLEINSKNFKLTIGSAKFALKSTNKLANIDICNEQLALSQLLLEGGIPCPRIVRSNGQALATSHDEEVWILSEFVEGDYFAGTYSEFMAVAAAIGKMQKMLGTLNPKNLPRSASLGSWDHTSKLLSEFLERKPEWSTLFPSKEYESMIREHETIARTFYEVSSNLSHLHDHVVPTHVDLHPHNILIRSDNTPLFLDIDSLQVSNKIQSLAFATYKLARQHVVSENLQDFPHEIARSTKAFADVLASNAGFQSSAIASFPVAANAEILRRISLIADLNMHHYNPEWNSVLPMHLSALHEVPLLFADFSN